MHIESGGIKPGEMMIMMSGRNVGKSKFDARALQRLIDAINERPIEDLVLNESRVNGSRYYTVEPIGGNWLEMETWARSVYGEPGDMWDSNDWCFPEGARWLMNNRKFWFRQEKDRNWFIVRWSSQ